MLECITVISGMLVMILEMTGARVMAPHLGTSITVWTSLIGVVLGCLALGAWLGGRLADQGPSTRRLALILAWAGIGMALTGFLHAPVASWIAAGVINPYLAAVLCACVLFGLPATFFGMVTPYIIRLRMVGLATSGRVVGRLYALSTLGSIAGTFLGGFALVSWFRSTHILLGGGAVMLLLSVLAWSRPLRVRVSLLVIILLGSWFLTSWTHFQEENGGIISLETPYNHIRIGRATGSAGRDLLYLRTDPGAFQSAMYMDDPAELALDYTRLYALGTVLVPQAQRVLMLGGGGYSVPKWLLAGRSDLNPDTLQVDVVEIDPGMTAAAKKYFQLPADKRLRVFHEDVRVFCNRNTTRYDLVFVDVFGSNYTVPFHAGTVEAAEAMRRAVADHGALLMNVIASIEGDAGRLLWSIRNSLAEHFAEVHTIVVGDLGNPNSIQNFMLLALPMPRPNILSAGHELAAFRHQLVPPNSSTPPLRDEFAPVERYALPLARPIL
jgi:spermidine synthase